VDRRRKRGLCTKSVFRAEKLPSSAEEVALVKGMILLTNTTRASAAASALPSSAEEGSLLKLRLFVQSRKHGRRSRNEGRLRL